MTTWSKNLPGLSLLAICSKTDRGTFSNAVTGLRLSEWHSGYRAYRTSALADIPLDAGVKAALLGSHNRARTVLDAVVAYEQGQWDQCDTHLLKLGLTVDMQEIYANALAWARQLTAADGDDYVDLIGGGVGTLPAGIRQDLITAIP